MLFSFWQVVLGDDAVCGACPKSFRVAVGVGAEMVLADSITL